MGSLTGSIGNLFGNTNQNANFSAQGTPLAQPSTVDQANSLYGQAQTGVDQQQALLQALQAQNGIQNQSNVYNQLQGVANGVGPNPAQAMLNQSTGQNVASQAALMAGQRGAGANAGLIARQAAEQGAALQQNAVGQGATMQANQSLNALGQLGGLATQQVGQQAGALQNYNAAAQGLQGNILNSINSQNNAAVGMQSNINNANAGISQTNANNTAKATSGLLAGAGAATLALKDGGRVPYDDGGLVGTVAKVLPAVLAALSKGGKVKPMPPHLKLMADIYHPHLALGGPVSETGPSGYQGNSNAIGDASEVDVRQKSNTGSQIGKGIKSLMNSGSGDVTPSSSIGSYAGADAGDAASDILTASRGGKVPAMVSPGEVYLPPKKAQAVAKDGKNPLKEGEKIPGKAKVQGDSLKNDVIPRKLESGGIVIPRSILQSDNPEKKAADFVAEHLEKNGSGDEQMDFKSALKKAILNRKAS